VKDSQQAEIPALFLQAMRLEQSHRPEFLSPRQPDKGSGFRQNAGNRTGLWRNSIPESVDADLVERQTGVGAHGLKKGQQARGRLGAFGDQSIERMGLGGGETTAGGPAQRRHVGACTEDLPEIMTQSPDVGTFGAYHIEGHEREMNLHYVKTVDDDLPRTALNLYPLASEPVQRNSIALQSRVHRGQLMYRTSQSLCGLVNIASAKVSKRFTFKNLPFGILGIGRFPQFEHSLVALLSLHQEFNQTRTVAHGNEQDTCCHRIEGSGMSDTASTQGFTNTLYHVMGGKPRRLVDDKETVHGIKKGGFKLFQNR
jgi:hypothetical protein